MEEWIENVKRILILEYRWSEDQDEMSNHDIFRQAFLQLVKLEDPTNYRLAASAIHEYYLENQYEEASEFDDDFGEAYGLE
jgi:hypothetical protein